MATYRVTVGDKEYQVDIEDVNAQPVRAVVNGRVIQVWVAEREPGEVTPGPALSAYQAPARAEPAAVASPPSRLALHPEGSIGSASRGLEGKGGLAQSRGLEGAEAQPAAGDGQGIRAPMPGSIVSVAVQAGDQVEVGQDVCVLEAMKMNNRIRAPRAGTVAQVHVGPGQQVQHGDLLVTYAD
jgi:biotin carboxyl carrier protein